MKNYSSTETLGKWRELLKGERLPAVIVDLDAFDRNLEKLSTIARSKGKKVRIATKSIRVPELLNRVLKSGAPFQGLMCYSAEEAAFLATQGFKNFLIAYPTVQDSDLKHLRALHEQKIDVSLIIDNVDHITALAHAFSNDINTHQPFTVVIDMDMSLRLFGGLLHLGVRRSPIRTIAQLGSLIDEIAKHPQLKLLGVMGYEAQIAGLGDRNPFKRFLNPIAKLVRHFSVKSVINLRGSVARLFEERQIPLELFNGGGSGSFNFAAAENSLTEITAGSGLLCSHLFDYYSNITFEPACFFALQAVRSSDHGYVTCQGGGYIASGSPGWDRLPVPYPPNEAELLNDEGCGEVQTPLKLKSGTEVKIGDVVFFRHAKAGELAERFNDYILVSNGKIVKRVPTYRGLNQCFF